MYAHTGDPTNYKMSQIITYKRERKIWRKLTNNIHEFNTY